MNKLITLTEFQTQFNEALENTFSKELLIKNELREIDSLLIDCNTQDLTFKKKSFLAQGFVKHKTSIFQLVIRDNDKREFMKAYEGFIRFGHYEFQRLPYMSEETNERLKLITAQAKELIDYQNWLESLTKGELKKDLKKSELSAKQKMLVLYYLGLNLNLENKSLSKVLGLVTGNSSENIRKILSHVALGKNDVRTKENLNKVYNTLKSSGLTEVANKVKKDLEKL